MKIFYDANVLLETLLESRKFTHIAAAALGRAEGATISPLSARLYVYFGNKEKHSTAELTADLAAYRVATMDEETIRWATKNRQDEDFEDALQVACAVLNDCDQIVTFDRGLAEHYNRFIDIDLLG